MTGLMTTLADLRDAARRLDGVAVRTPLIRHPALDEAVGGPVWLKLETLQVAGSFKFRGAYNRISRLTDQERARGVVAYSSGNHAQGVAAAARRVGTSALIVMPSDSPAVKIEGVRAFGGEVRLYDRWRESREAIGAEIAAQRDAVLVPPFDDPFVIAGQGTVGLELLDQAPGPLDQILCPASGGGLMAGINIALAELSPKSQAIIVEPEGFDDHRRSLEAGTPTPAPPGAAPSVCDALMAPLPGRLTWPINSVRVGRAVAVSDTEVAQAVGFAFRRLKLVVEPGGAVGLAALLSGKVEAKGLSTAVILSGANVDPALHAALVAGRLPEPQSQGAPA